MINTACSNKHIHFRKTETVILWWNIFDEYFSKNKLFNFISNLSCVRYGIGKVNFNFHFLIEISTFLFINRNDVVANCNTNHGRKQNIGIWSIIFLENLTSVLYYHSRIKWPLFSICRHTKKAIIIFCYGNTERVSYDTGFGDDSAKIGLF